MAGRPSGVVPEQDFEALTVIFSVTLVAAIVALLATLPARQEEMAGVQGYALSAHLRSTPVVRSTARHDASQILSEPRTERERRIAERFQQAVALLHARQYDYAITALDAVLEMAPRLPEAYVNMGYAFLGLKEYGPARGAFEAAINLKLDQVNAYYGLAVAFEGLGDYEAALGAMRSYIHLSLPDDPFLAKARAALWEWEAQLGRIEGVEPVPEGMEPEIASSPSPRWSEGHGKGR
jgi:tetratricopeptide (TPR) repeat protein